MSNESGTPTRVSPAALDALRADLAEGQKRLFACAERLMLQIQEDSAALFSLTIAKLKARAPAQKLTPQREDVVEIPVKGEWRKHVVIRSTRLGFEVVQRDSNGWYEFAYLYEGEGATWRWPAADAVALRAEIANLRADLSIARAERNGALADLERVAALAARCRRKREETRETGT